MSPDRSLPSLSSHAVLSEDPAARSKLLNPQRTVTVSAHANFLRMKLVTLLRILETSVLLLAAGVALRRPCWYSGPVLESPSGCFGAICDVAPRLPAGDHQGLSRCAVRSLSKRGQRLFCLLVGACWIIKKHETQRAPRLSRERGIPSRALGVWAGSGAVRSPIRPECPRWRGPVGSTRPGEATPAPGR